MSTQPPSRTRFYRNKRDGKLMGICAGIADYTGMDVTLVRIMTAAAFFMSGGTVLPLYIVSGWIAPDRPREFERESLDEKRFWQQVRASPQQSSRDIRSRLRDIDRRLADIEHHVTTENRSLANEIDRLR